MYLNYVEHIKIEAAASRTSFPELHCRHSGHARHGQSSGAVISRLRCRPTLSLGVLKGDLSFHKRNRPQVPYT